MFKNLRQTFYADSFLQMLFNYYKDSFSYIPVTYYHWDKSNSVYDNELLMGGAWHDTGPLSGLKWNKVVFFPAALIEQTTKQTNANEQGVYTFQETTMVVPYVGLVPTAYDYMYFTLNNTVDNVLYQIQNIEIMYNNDTSHDTFYKLTLQAVDETAAELDNHTLNTYYFNEIIDRIQTYEDYIDLTTSVEEAMKLAKDVNNVIRTLNVREIVL